MRTKHKKAIFLILSITLALSLSSCGKSMEKRYENYVKSLIAINYLGATDEYIKATGANKSDAEALYNANINDLSESILKYYGISLADDSDLHDEYRELAKNIYSKVNYKVSNAYKENDSYKVDVEIYPIDIFRQTNDDIIAHIALFNQKVADGEFNDYTIDAYNDEFSAGILEILNTGCENMQYADLITITVEIITEGNSYYISDSDLLLIDASMIYVSDTTQDATPQ